MNKNPPENLPHPADVESGLRDRIAALLELLRPVTPKEAADAVIAELGLKHYCRECGGWGPKDV